MYRSLISPVAFVSVPGMIARIRITICLLILLILGASLSIFPLQDFDVWFHLATGRYILEHTTIPHHDVFSHTAHGSRWITHEWLTEVLFVVLYRSGGITGLIGFKALVVCLTALTLFVLGRRVRLAPEWILTVLTPCLFMISFRAFVRPHILTELCLAVLLLMLYGFPDVTRNHGRWLIPLGMLLWANLHSGALLGYITLVIVLGSGICMHGRFARVTAPPLKHTIQILVVSFIALLCNPNFLDGLLYPLMFIRDPFFFEVISELQPSFSSEYAGADFQIAMLVLSGIWLGSWVFSRAKWRIDDLLLFGIWFAWALRANRNVPLLAISAAPAVLFRLSEIQSRLRLERFVLLNRLLGILGILIPVALVFRVHATGVNMASDGYRKPGLGTADMKYPVGAADFLSKLPFDGTLFNEFSFGGYLIWSAPDHPVFIDGRLDVFPPDVFHDYAGAYRGDVSITELESHYGINVCMLAYPSRKTTAIPAVYTELSASTNWGLVYWDDHSLVYVRRNPGIADWFDRNVYRHIDPLQSSWGAIDSQIGESPEETLAEARRAQAACPQCIGPQIILGRALELSRDFSQAKAAYQAVLSIKPNHPAVHNQLGFVYIQLKDFFAAEAVFRELLESTPDDALLHLNLGVALHHTNRRNEAIAEYLRAFSLNPNHYDTNVNLGIAFAEAGQFDRARFHWGKALEINPGANQIRQNLERIRNR